MNQVVEIAVPVVIMLYIAWRIYKNVKANDGFVLELLFMIWLAISIVGNAVLPDGFLPFYVQIIIYVVLVRLVTRPPRSKDNAESQE